MVHTHCAVLINMDKCTRLIEVGQGKGNTEFDWCQGNTLFQYRIFNIPLTDALPPSKIITLFDQSICHRIDYAISNLHTIGRCLYLLRCFCYCVFVIIAFAHLDRIETQVVSDMIYHSFHTDHTLWSPKSTKGRRALSVCAQAMTFNPAVIQMISIIRMKHCAVSHRQRKIL